MAGHFWKSVSKSSESDCWEWAGKTLTDDGAGYWLFNHGVEVVQHDGKHTTRALRYRVTAHRAALTLQGLNLDADDIVFRAKCRNMLCVNPEHLAVGDHEANVAARHAAGNTVRGSENGRAKLTEAQVAVIKKELRAGMTRAQLAKRYKVERRTIWGIDKGKVWKHVP
jgi:hypothetical protein